MSVYLRLYNGHCHPKHRIKRKIRDGPVLGPLQHVRTTNAAHIALIGGNNESGQIAVADGMVYYNGRWYSDWSVSDESVLMESAAELFDLKKADTQQLYYVQSAELDNPLVRCPKCGYQARLMDGFSLLAAGFNGIKAGDAEDLDLQECGRCLAKLHWY